MRTLYDIICVSEFVLFNNAVIIVLFFWWNSETAALQYDMGRRNKRQFNSTYVFAQRQNVVADDYGMGVVRNNGIWLLSLYCLNTWKID